MHIGIRFTMGPWYFSNVWCFILLVDWGAARRWARDSWVATRLRSVAQSSGFKPITELNDKAQTSAAKPPETGEDQDLPVAAAGRAAGFGTAFLALMAAVSLFQIEWWPLTNVDLYSAYFSDEILASYPRSYYRDASRAQEIARETSTKGRLRLAQNFLAYHVELKLIGKDEKVLLLPDGVGVVTQKQWVKSVLMPVVVADLNAKPDGDIAWNAEYPNNPATLFLKRILPVIRRNVPQWQEYDRVVLTYALEGPHPVIASISLHEEES